MGDVRAFFRPKLLIGIIYLVTLGDRSVYIGQELQTDIRYCKEFNKFNTYGKLLNQRMKSHRTASKNMKGGCRAFNAAIRKYGFDSFTFTIIHQFNASTEAQLRITANSLETHEISKHKTFGKWGYNLTTGGQSDFAVSQETRDILSAKGKARKGKFTETARANMSAALMGHSVSDKTKSLISQRLKEGFTDERRMEIAERNSKLSNTQRDEIVERYKQGNISATDLASEYEVSLTTITNIIKDKNCEFIHGKGGHYAYGSIHPRAKINETIARSIYELKDKQPRKVVASMFNVSPGMVWNIWSHRHWKSIHEQQTQEVAVPTTPN